MRAHLSEASDGRGEGKMDAGGVGLWMGGDELGEGSKHARVLGEPRAPEDRARLDGASACWRQGYVPLGQTRTDCACRRLPTPTAQVPALRRGGA